MAIEPKFHMGLIVREPGVQKIKKLVSIPVEADDDTAARLAFFNFFHRQLAKANCGSEVVATLYYRRNRQIPDVLQHFECKKG